MAVLVSEPETYLKRHLDRRAKVLLVNPPVQERRYHWLRWNQPTELLRLSSWLKSTSPGIDVRLIDFMFPDAANAVPKHKVKETWTGSQGDAQLWHFGETFEAFEAKLAKQATSGWSPDMIVISSLTSYWHVSIEKLLIKLCSHLGRKRRKLVKLCLYGNYPRFEPEHAGAQADADVAFTRPVVTSGVVPDFGLYLEAHDRPPAFFGLDVEDEGVEDHLDACLALQTRVQKQRGITRLPAITVAFFNEDVCSPASQLQKVARFAERHPKQLVVEGIAGIEPRSLTLERLRLMKAAGFRSLFVEHARLPGGGIDEQAYHALLAFLRDEEHQKKSGGSTGPWMDRGDVTGFVSMGLPDDDIDELVRSTLVINSYFQAVILKPYGYSPSVDGATAEERRVRWRGPCESSPQWFPYVGHGSVLRRDDYDNLVRWQNVLNKRVKGATFDFLDDGSVAKMVRETLVAEHWKRHQEAR
jgi:hypothetical protein